MNLSELEATFPQITIPSLHLEVNHRTHYWYSQPVQENYNELRLHPPTNDPRRLDYFLLTVYPPVRLSHYRDQHLNYVHYFSIPEAHNELRIDSRALLRTTTQYPQARLPLGVDFKQIRQLPEEISPFIEPSPYVDKDLETWKLALDIRNDCPDVFGTAVAMMQFIHREFSYDTTATNVKTHGRDVLKLRRGVCQDFAHLMLAMCRCLNIPARYVSGYLYNGPTEQLRGAQASHAWCEIYLPQLGWFGLDPTNACLVDGRYVKVATGRDYQDAAPVSGWFYAGGYVSSNILVTVKVDLYT